MKKRKRGNSEGSIYKMQDGRWRAAVTVSNDAAGKPKRMVFTARTRHEVNDQLTGALKDKRLGMLVAPHKQTVAQFLTRWLSDVVKPASRPKTVNFYDFVTRIHLIPAFGDMQIQKLTAQHVQAMLNDRLSSASSRTRRPLSPRSVRHIHRTLCTALNAAVKYRIVPVNVALSADPPPARKPNIRFFSVVEPRNFLEVARTDRLYALFATVLSLGLRLGEALGVACADVDFAKGRFNVRQALQRIDKKLFPPEKAGLRLVEPKGGYSNRVAILPTVAISALQHHMAQQETDRKWAGMRWRNEWNLVFTSRVGRPLDERGVLRRFHKLLAMAGLPKMRIHDLRHSAVAILIAQGVNIKAISDLLGHSSVAFTLQVYGHLLEETKRESADKMHAALAPVATSVATKRISAKVN